MQSVILLNEIMLIMCTCDDEKEKKERLKVCAEKIRWSMKLKGDKNNKRKSNEITETLDEEEEDKEDKWSHRQRRIKRSK